MRSLGSKIIVIHKRSEVTDFGHHPSRLRHAYVLVSRTRVQN